MGAGSSREEDEDQGEAQARRGLRRAPQLRGLWEGTHRVHWEGLSENHHLSAHLHNSHVSYLWYDRLWRDAVCVIFCYAFCGMGYSILNAIFCEYQFGVQLDPRSLFLYGYVGAIALGVAVNEFLQLIYIESYWAPFNAIFILFALTPYGICSSTFIVYHFHYKHATDDEKFGITRTIFLVILAINAAFTIFLLQTFFYLGHVYLLDVYYKDGIESGIGFQQCVYLCYLVFGGTLLKELFLTVNKHLYNLYDPSCFVIGWICIFFDCSIVSWMIRSDTPDLLTTLCASVSDLVGVICAVTIIIYKEHFQTGVDDIHIGRASNRGTEITERIESRIKGTSLVIYIMLEELVELIVPILTLFNLLVQWVIKKTTNQGRLIDGLDSPDTGFGYQTVDFEQTFPNLAVVISTEFAVFMGVYFFLIKFCDIDILRGCRELLILYNDVFRDALIFIFLWFKVVLVYHPFGIDRSLEFTWLNN